MITPWQEKLLWHFLRTGDYWVGLMNEDSIQYSGYILFIVGGRTEDLKKLYAIKEILGGSVRPARDYYRGPSTSPWEYLWIGGWESREYLEWFEDKWANHNIIDAHNRRWRVKEVLAATHESYQHRQA